MRKIGDVDDVAQYIVSRSAAPMITNPRPKLILPLVAFLLSCASSQTSPEIVIAPGSTVTADQLQALRQSLPANTDAYLVDIREFPAQMTLRSGRTTHLWAEALGVPRKVSAHLCRGELTLFTLPDEEFDLNTWRAFPQREQYAAYDTRGLDPCALARERVRRFWVRGGVSSDELAGILELFTAAVRPDEAKDSLAKLLGDESIAMVIRSASLEDGSVIEIHTSQGSSHGRIIEFEKRDGVWIGRVKGGWIA